ncbi:MAG: polysaccharide biosynthesis protein, partial [Bacteroidota bacterium]|nr:polysaccharide biosynthesis protein [Bacteroidota bacterium]
MNKLYDIISNLITSGNSRSVKAKKNIIYSFVIRGVSMLTTLFLVPITLGYVTEVEYGIWITLSTFIIWFSIFDVGLGNGLRNKFAEAIAKKDTNLARTYVSTTYAGLTIIFGAVLIIFLGIFPFVNWNLLFQAGDENSNNIRILVLILFVFFTIRFILQLISTLLIADQRPAIASLIDPITNLIVLVIIY